MIKSLNEKQQKVAFISAGKAQLLPSVMDRETADFIRLLFVFSITIFSVSEIEELIGNTFLKKDADTIFEMFNLYLKFLAEQKTVA